MALVASPVNAWSSLIDRQPNRHNRAVDAAVRATTCEWPPPSPQTQRRSERQTDRRHDLVGQGLALAVPQREQEPDVADDRVDEVRELPHQRHTEAERLPGDLTDHFELEDRFADARAGGALPV